MTWTYTGDPTDSPRDEIRFLLGDTDPNDQQLSDEEIAYLVATYPDTYSAAAAGAEQRAAYYSRKAEDETLGRRRETYGDRAEKYQDLAERLRTGASAAGVVAAAPRAPQIRKSTRAAAAADADRQPTAFETGMMRHDGS